MNNDRNYFESINLNKSSIDYNKISISNKLNSIVNKTLDPKLKGIKSHRSGIMGSNLEIAPNFSSITSHINHTSKMNRS